MEIVIWLIVGLVVGGVIGALATWWISRARGGAVSVMQLKQENDRFKDEVTEHFVETARLINQMTDSYKQVFDHLSNGAEKLVDEKSLAERLPPASGEEVKLSQFGASVSAGAGQDRSDQPRRGADESNRSPSAAPTKASESTDPLKNKSGGAASSVSRQSASKSESDKASSEKAGGRSEAGSEEEKSDRKTAGEKEEAASAAHQASADSSDKSARNA